MTAVIHARSMEERLAWLGQVRKSSLSRANSIRAAMYLFECCNSLTGQCNPSRSRIERECGMSNAKRAIRDLEEAGLIEVEARNQRSNQYYLLLQPDDNFQHGSAVTQGGVRCDPGVGSAVTQGVGSAVTPEPVIINLESEPGTEPGTAGASEPGTESGLIPEDWRPSEAGLEFASRLGMDNREVERQVPLFVAYNLDIRRAASNWSRYWQAWVTNWERHRVERLQVEPSGDKVADSIRRAIKSETPCWQRVGGKGRTPERDPAGFVRSGCSMFGGCMCSQEQRQEIVDRTVPVRAAAPSYRHQPTNSRY